MDSTSNTFTEALDIAAIKRPFNEYAWCLIRSAIFKKGDSRIALFTRFEFGIGEEPCENRMIDMGKLVLDRKFVDQGEAMTALRSGNLQHLVDANTSLFDSLRCHIYTPRTPWLGWYPTRDPCYCIEKEAQDTGRESIFPQHEINDLYRNYLPHGLCQESFPSVVDAIDYWIPFSGKSLQKSLGNTPLFLQVTFPIDAGQIAGAEETDCGLLVHISPGLPESDMHVVLAFNDGDSHIWKNELVQNSMALFPDIPNGEFVLKVLYQDCLLDYMKNSRDRLARKKSPSHRSIQDLIANGEREDCEFKEFGSNNIGDQFIRKHVLRTIVGFSNSNGGNLLLGVSDYGEAIGLERDDEQPWMNQLCCPKDGLKEAIIARIKKLVSDQVEGIPNITYDWTDFLGVAVLHIHISGSGAHRPTIMVGGDMYVRKGGKTLKATRSDVLRIKSISTIT